MTGIVDWYTSNGCGVFDDGPDQRHFVGPARIDGDHVRITGGSDYRKLSDGTRNCLYDRIFITVSDDFDEVLPSLANPKSPYMAETARRIYCSRPNFLTEPKAAEDEVAFWTRLKAYGMDDMFIRYHSEVFRTPLENNRFGRSSDTYAGLGDETLIKMVKGIQALGHKVAPYGDEQLLHGLAPQYDVTKIALDYAYRPHQRWYYNNYLARPYVQIQHAVDFIPGFREKFGWDGVYSDEITNTPPWGHVDFEAGVPGAGKLTEVLYAYMLLLEVNRNLYKGPVWSEGTSHYFWAGYSDMNYAQSNRPDNPLIVNFQLSQLHTRQNDIGYELVTWKQWSIDYWLASTIIFGNMGSLVPRDGAPSMMQGAPDCFPEHGNLAKCYFMMRALQELYAGQPPAVIRYADDRGVLHDTSDAVRRDITANNMVYVKYANGLETWVNRHQQKSWTIDFNGAGLILPPNGYAAFLDGRILEYSAGTSRTDYARTPLYSYADGRGSRTEFPSLTAAGAYMWRRKDNGIELIPQYPVKPETITLKNIKSVRQVIPQDEKGHPLGSCPEFRIVPAGLELKIEPDTFKYFIVTTGE